MNTLRRAVQEYLDLRRGLGFKLRDTGTGLIDFVGFLRYPGPGACMGSTAYQRAAGALGSTAEFHTRFRAVSECY